MITIDFKRLEVRSGYRILDMGCGSGRHTAEAAKCAGARAIGADLNPGDLIQARDRLLFHENLGLAPAEWSFAAADVTDLPFDNRVFDVVICSEVLEHIPDHEKAVRELNRVLKPGGGLAVSVPRTLPERICWALADDYHQSNGGHVRIYKRKELTRLLESNGFQLRSSHYAHALHTPYWWLKCLTGPTRTDSRTTNLYHDLLVWDMMKKPKITRGLERLLNPLFGKSLVLYLNKTGGPQILY